MVRQHRHLSLPTRHGLGPTRIVLSAVHQGKTLAQGLADHSGRPYQSIVESFTAGDVVDRHGQILDPYARIDDITVIHVYREPLDETPVPFELTVLAHTDRLIVVDKPPFMATMPRGMHVRETALIKTRNLTHIDTLTPAHRLDRLTAGVLLMVINPKDRGAYQQLFATGRVKKSYEALAAQPPPQLNFPLEVRTRIEKTPGIMRAVTVAGAPNAVSVIDYLGPSGDHGLYSLRPLTGKTHQLRIHMNTIGLPIVGDPLYPNDIKADPADFSQPLRLLARELSFIDPIDSQPCVFTSRQQLFS